VRFLGAKLHVCPTHSLLRAAKADPMAARPTWTGTISFALLSVPVKLYTATRAKDISFNQLEKSTQKRIKQKKVSGETGEEVSGEDIVKGYDLGGGRYVLVDDAELDALAPTNANNEKVIQVMDFVNLPDIDPVYFEKAYYIAPDKGGARAYGLLVRALASSQKVAIAKVVMRSKEYLTAIRPMGDVLCMETMMYADEVVPVTDIDELANLTIDVNDKELDMAKMLIESSAGEFEPTKYKDEYRDKVIALIEAKAAGQTYEVPKIAESAPVVDLMAALEASLAAAKTKKSA
jgi:DNA end-binding protein Ku